MGKRILIGSMLVLTLLLLMPSIPAIQQKTIEDKAFNDLEEQMKTIDFEKLKDIMDLGEFPKHPLLRALVVSLYNIQGLRFSFYFVMAFFVFCDPPDNDLPGGPDVTNPILFFICILRAAWLFGTAMYWATFWDYISELLGWNWNIYPW
ncbi:MAG: hypothetical protein KAW47_06175 [Thermoplasmatales archaeon]|nr:hypothetical protein [Thermoplasmatales archaeon]